MPSSASRALTTVACLACLLHGCHGPDRGTKPPTGPLVSALVAEQMRLPALPVRTSVTSKYRECRARFAAEWRACQMERTSYNPMVVNLGVRASADAQSTGSADALHAAGLVDLLYAGDSAEALAAASRELRAACLVAPSCAEIGADLSGAELTRGLVRGDAMSVASAIEAADLALQDDSSNAVAMFNLALGQEALGLTAMATESWRAYLRRDRTSRWAQVAQEHELDLGRVLGVHAEVLEGATASDAQTQRTVAFDSLLPDWGAAMRHGDTSSARLVLERARQMGLSLQGGDQSVAVAVELITRAQDGDGVLRLAGAFEAYGEGVRAYGASAYEVAARRLAEAHTLAPSPSPLSAWIAFYLSLTALHRQPARVVRPALVRSLAAIDATRFPALEARYRWALATTALREGDPPRAAMLARQAQAIFARLGESENYGAVRHIEASAYVEAGNERRMYDALAGATSSLMTVPHSHWRRSALRVLADAIASRFPRTAARVRSEVVSSAEGMRDPLPMVQALAARAQSYVTMGDRAKVAHDLRVADSLLTLVPAGEGRDWEEVSVLWLQAAEQSDSRRSITLLDSAERLLRTTEVPAPLLKVLAARSAAYTRIDDTQRAERDLQRAATIASQVQHRMLDRQSAVDYWTAAGRVHDALALLAVREHRFADALVEVERRLAGNSSSMSIAAIPRLSAPPGTQVVVLHQIGDSLLVFRQRKDRTDLWVRPISADTLSRTVDRVRYQLERRAALPVVRADLERLYSWLLGDAMASVDTESLELRLVASGVLGNLPYAALIEASSGRFVVERSSLSVFNTVAGALRSPRPMPTSPEHAVVISDPAFDRETFPELRPLPETRAEADTIATLYHKVVRLAGPEATADRVVNALRGADVAHFGMHALFNELEPDASLLVLAKDADPVRQRDLSAKSIRSLRLGAVGLVVLASCRSSVSGRGIGEGLLGFADAFQQAGVRGVIGSLWDVDDREAARFVTEFHRHYASGVPATSALRLTQLSFLRAGEGASSPGSWAAFSYSGH